VVKIEGRKFRLYLGLAQFIVLDIWQIWEDETLKEWDPADFRIFCGDLGNDVTDEVLARTFGRYPSFVKAKVIRDKKTNKTKGDCLFFSLKL